MRKARVCRRNGGGGVQDGGVRGGGGRPRLLLVVGGSGEGLRLLGGDGSITRDELGHHAAEGLDTEPAGFARRGGGDGREGQAGGGGGRGGGKPQMARRL
eukprot:3459273-Pleurochrysis_carterae.AAC.1